MLTVSETLTVLTGMLMPAAMVTACSLFLLGVYDKYAKVIASLRTLNTELRRTPQGDYTLSGPEHRERCSKITKEQTILRQRLDSVLQQMQAIAGAAIAFLLASLIIGAGTVLHINAGAAVLVLIASGILLVGFAMLKSAMEVVLISRTIDIELTLPGNSEFEFKSGDSILGRTS